MNEEYIKKAQNYIREKTECYGAGNLEEVLKDDKFFDVNFDYRIEGRTRDTNYTEALRLRVHDPLHVNGRWESFVATMQVLLCQCNAKLTMTTVPRILLSLLPSRLIRVSTSLQR